MAKQNKKLSIVIPIYNTEKYLPDCLDSILKNNNLAAVEVILVNDGSTDGSEAICKDYIDRHKGIFKYIKTKNSGLSEARNNGLKNASGEMVWFVDSDDEIEPNSIDKIVLQRGSHDILMIGYKISSGGKKCTDMPMDNTGNPVKNYLINTPIVPIRIFNRAFLNKIDFRFKKGRFYEDSGSMYGLVKHTTDIKYINEPLYVYKKRGGSITLDGEIESKSEDRYWAANEIAKTVPDGYRSERDFQIIKTIGLFYTFDIIKYVKGGKRTDMLKKARSYMESTVPNYWNNEYVRRKTTIMRGYRLYLKCLHAKCFFLCKIISAARRVLI